MKGKELMIGDWALTATENGGEFIGKTESIGKMPIKGNEYVYVVKIHDERSDLAVVARCDSISPIPLTKEILEKNGFRYDNFNEVYRWMTDAGCERYPTFYIFQRNCRGKRYGDFYIYSIPMKFVHELQRALRCRGLWEFAENFKI